MRALSRFKSVHLPTPVPLLSTCRCRPTPNITITRIAHPYSYSCLTLDTFLSAHHPITRFPYTIIHIVTYISRTPQPQHQRALPLQSLIVFSSCVRYIASFVPTTVFSYPLFSYPLLLCVSYIDDIVSAVPSYLAVSPLSLFFLPLPASSFP